MGAEVKDGVVVVEGGLRAVAVVHVEVGDHDPRVAEPLGVAGRHGGVVDQAEAHAPGRLRVVPRRADRAESPGDLARAAGVERAADGARGGDGAASQERGEKNVSGSR